MNLSSDIITALTPERDIHGATIAVGTTVRSFDFPMHTREGRVLGMDTEGDGANFIEGVVELIGGEPVEGCPRYRIAVTRRVVNGAEIDMLGMTHIYPPVNGTRALFTGSHTFGVVAK